MPVRKFNLEEDSPYHIVTRGVDRRPLFLNEHDHLRFILQLYLVNFDLTINNLKPALVEQIGRALLEGGTLPKNIAGVRQKPLVYLLCFALMPNHIHLLLLPNQTDGIQRLMHRLLTSYAMYFNLKTERKGALFQNRFSAVPIKDQLQLDVATRYINVNPLGIWQPGWRREGLKNWSRALAFLRQYPWSSYPDFIRARNSHLLPPARILDSIYADSSVKLSQQPWYDQFIKEYLEDGEYYKEPA